MAADSLELWSAALVRRCSAVRRRWSLIVRMGGGYRWNRFVAAANVYLSGARASLMGDVSHPLSAWQARPPAPPSLRNPLGLGPRPLRVARATIALQAIGTAYLAAMLIFVALLAVAAGARWLAAAGIVALIGLVIFGVAVGLYRVMVQLGRFSRRARIAATLIELALAAPGFAMAVVGNAASAADPNQGPFADGELALMVLLGGAFAAGAFIVVVCLTLPQQVRRLFASNHIDSAFTSPPPE